MIHINLMSTSNQELETKRERERNHGSGDERWWKVLSGDDGLDDGDDLLGEFGR